MTTYPQLLSYRAAKFTVWNRTAEMYKWEEKVNTQRTEKKKTKSEMERPRRA